MTGYGIVSSTQDRVYEIFWVAFVLLDFFVFLLRVVRWHSGLEGADFTVSFSRSMWFDEA
jgi:hypothetical protein